MIKGRPKFGFLIFDFPSDHEISDSLVTESETIKAVLSNRNLGSRLKVVRCSSIENFESIPKRQYSGIRYVHMGGHGSKNGLAFIGGSAKWGQVATTLKALLPPLKEGEQRVLSLSCCHSEDGIKAMSPHLKGYFSSAYHFLEESVSFSEAITVWSMFYLKKKLNHPHKAVVKDINKFIGKDLISFEEI